MSTMGMAEQVLLSAAMCLFSVWLGARLYRAEQEAAAQPIIAE